MKKYMLGIVLMLSAFSLFGRGSNADCLEKIVPLDYACTSTTTTTTTTNQDGSTSTSVTVSVTCDTPAELIAFIKLQNNK
jgi:hypothetical protein